MADREKTKEEIEQEMEAALDWDSSDSFEASLASADDREDEVEEESEEQADDAESVEEDDSDVATKDDEESTESDDDEDGVQTYTLDGKKYTPEQIAADPKLLSKMATHYNQVGNFQKLLDEERSNVSERERKIAELEAEKQRIEREWIARKMSEENERRQAKERESAPKPVPRPDNKILRTQLEPYINQLKEDGRLTEDEIDEHSGLLAEYIYDYANMQTMIQSVAAQLLNRVEQIEKFVNPAIQTWDREHAVQEEKSIQLQAAKIEGYEELADPETWEDLKAYISNKIANSPKGKDGRPTFDPIFDAETMAEQYDAMMGKALRKTLSEVQKKAQKQKTEDAKRAGGNASTGGKEPKRRPKPKGTPTAQDAALDWGDGRFAG